MSSSVSLVKYGMPRPPPKSRVRSGRPSPRRDVAGDVHPVPILPRQDRVVENLSASKQMQTAELDGRMRPQQVENLVETLLVDTERSRLATHAHGAALRPRRPGSPAARRARECRAGSRSPRCDRASRADSTWISPIPRASASSSSASSCQVPRTGPSRARAPASEPEQQLTRGRDLEPGPLGQKMANDHRIGIGLDRVGDGEFRRQGTAQKRPLPVEDAGVVRRRAACRIATPMIPDRECRRRGARTRSRAK